MEATEKLGNKIKLQSSCGQHSATIRNGFHLTRAICLVQLSQRSGEGRGGRGRDAVVVLSVESNPPLLIRPSFPP